MMPLETPVNTGPGPWKLAFGATTRRDGVEFRVWAPHARSLAVKVFPPQPVTLRMTRESGAEFVVFAPGLSAGADYMYILEDERQCPDPVSRWQPAGVHGPSRIVDSSAFRWSDQDWQGADLEQFIIYEIHAGTFTPEGTFDSIARKLPYLRQLGITAVELMPVAEFPGRCDWGYDGASLYAPQSSYGGPTGLKSLVDACHREGLAVVLDVVYNHLGPEGNYLGEFAPCFTSRYSTPWGDAINFDGPESHGVRRFFLENALYWLTEYHIDALRLDAIQEIFDSGARHFLQELSQAFHAEAERLGRRAWIIAESDLNDVRVIHNPSLSGYGLDAQWHDDFHHALFTVLTGSRRGYLADFGSLHDLKKSICDGFVFDGRYSPYRNRRHGSSSRDVPGRQFVAHIQNHDQVANASLGVRLSGLVSPEQQKLAAAVVLCAPFVPLLFMGQEYGETAPFLFFTSYGDPRLAEAVRAGRRKEYAAFYSDSDFPDPQAAATFEKSKLSWALAGRQPHAGLLRFYRELIDLRKRLPCLANCRKDLAAVECADDPGWLVMRRTDPNGSRALLVGNFSPVRADIPVCFSDVAWTRALWSGDARFAGSAEDSSPPASLPARATAQQSIALSGFEAAIYVGE